MGKRKVFVKTDLTVSQVEHVRAPDGVVEVDAAALPPAVTRVDFARNPSANRGFDFGPWYGCGIDPITYACQRQIERFVEKQDADLQVATIVGYCVGGLTSFLNHMTLQASAALRTLGLRDIDRDMIDSYLLFLRDQGWAMDSQRTCYSYTKSVLLALARRSLVHVVDRGDKATFPRNPFPGSTRDGKGARPLSVAEKKAFTLAVRSAIRPLLECDDEPNSYLAGCALLVVALHTGRNTTPLLELDTQCLRAHPKEGIEFLVVYKRRGHNTSHVALRASSPLRRVVESTPTLRATVAQLLRRYITLTATLRQEAPEDLRGRVWLYRRRRDNEQRGSALTTNTLEEAVKRLVREYDLRGDDERPMQINISRLRKTFVNRIFEILEGDVAATAAAAGNTATVTMRNYLRPSDEAQQNWRFLGQVLVQELLTNTLGATEKTPVGQCSDSQGGEYAPKRDAEFCQSFLNCLRCRNYVVTGDDLWRLFSFYFRVLRERPRVDKRRWRLQLAHIPRLIDRDVVQAGLERKLFKREQVDSARQRARRDPHPFWAGPSIIDALHSLG